MENACDELCPHMESQANPIKLKQIHSTEEFFNFIEKPKEEQERELSISSLNDANTCWVKHTIGKEIDYSLYSYGIKHMLKLF